MPAMAILSKLLVGIAHPALLHREILLVVLNHRGHSGYYINKQLDTPKYHKCVDRRSNYISDIFSVRPGLGL